jgi:hypothetical protein
MLSCINYGVKLKNIMGKCHKHSNGFTGTITKHLMTQPLRQRKHEENCLSFLLQTLSWMNAHTQIWRNVKTNDISEIKDNWILNPNLTYCGGGGGEEISWLLRES